MGQSEVKIHTDGYILEFQLTQYNKLKIQAKYIDEYGDQFKQYKSIFKYHELPKQIRDQFSNNQMIMSQLYNSSGVCCAVRSSPYSFNFKEGKFIIKKRSKVMKICLKKVGKSSDKTNDQGIELSKVSLQQRLENEISDRNYSLNQGRIMNYNQKQNPQKFSGKSDEGKKINENHQLSNFLILSRNGLILNLSNIFL